MLALKQNSINLEISLNRRIENYWNKRSKDFSRVRRIELNGIDANIWQNLIEQHLPQEKDLNILDVGTGAGFFAIILAKLGHKVTGIDMSSAMLLEAKKNMLQYGCRADFIKMNAQELNFDDKIFDVVISRNLTWTLPDAMQAYREWHRVLKIGGMLINFDSDCGQTTFSKKSDEADVHANINDDLLQECNDIKNNLRISTHRRPDWDIQCLDELGFNVTFDENIAPMVHQDNNCHYDSIPIFAVYAKKA